MRIAWRVMPRLAGLVALMKAFSESADPVLRRMAGLHLQRICTGLGRDRDAVGVALRLSHLYPDDPEVLYHSGRTKDGARRVHSTAHARRAAYIGRAAGEAGCHTARPRPQVSEMTRSPPTRRQLFVPS